LEAEKQIKRLEESPKPESRREAKKPEAEQQEKEGEEAGGSEADLTETGRGEHSKEQTEEDKKQIMRYETLKERLGSPAPPAAGETSAVVTEGVRRLCRLVGYTIPRAVSPIPKSYFESLPSTLDGCIIRAPETVQEQLLFEILADRPVAVRPESGELPQTAFPDSEGEICTRSKEESIQERRSQEVQ
jgi:hypothetical protein